jgi:hypothetical protein
LLPLGGKRIGRSRTWITDQRFWTIVVEFQPSGWSKGTYLNVGACWLWYPKSHWSFDNGYRIEGFTPFEDADQFAVIAERLATRAADEIRIMRAKFNSISGIARELVPPPNAHGWRLYHGAVAAGLSGNGSISTRLFEQLAAEPITAGWMQALQTTCLDLAKKVGDPNSYRTAVLALIEQSRALHKLAPDPTCLDGA